MYIKRMSFGNMDDYSLSDLAGSGAIILASVGGLLTIILSSRCYIKCRLGLTDNCNICMCERKPPPDPEDPQAEQRQQEKEERYNASARYDTTSTSTSTQRLHRFGTIITINTTERYHFTLKV